MSGDRRTKTPDLTIKKNVYLSLYLEETKEAVPHLASLSLCTNRINVQVDSFFGSVSIPNIWYVKGSCCVVSWTRGSSVDRRIDVTIVFAGVVL